MEFELKQVKLDLDATDQLKLDLAIAVKAWDTSYATATKAQNKVVVVGAQMDKALLDLVEL